ncbi:hypothetical protein DIPPA_19064 [Diplonema papillatum]|nr:hypothetical protein DIPPA_19064 [Diplonema papillatum]
MGDWKVWNCASAPVPAAEQLGDAKQRLWRPSARAGLGTLDPNTADGARRYGSYSNAKPPGTDGRAPQFYNSAAAPSDRQQQHHHQHHEQQHHHQHHEQQQSRVPLHKRRASAPVGSIELHASNSTPGRRARRPRDTALRNFEEPSTPVPPVPTLPISQLQARPATAPSQVSSGASNCSSNGANPHTHHSNSNSVMAYDFASEECGDQDSRGVSSDRESIRLGSGGSVWKAKNELLQAQQGDAGVGYSRAPTAAAHPPPSSANPSPRNLGQAGGTHTRFLPAGTSFFISKAAPADQAPNHPANASTPFGHTPAGNGARSRSFTTAGRGQQLDMPRWLRGEGEKVDGGAVWYSKAHTDGGQRAAGPPPQADNPQQTHRKRSVPEGAHGTRPCTPPPTPSVAGRRVHSLNATGSAHNNTTYGHIDNPNNSVASDASDAGETQEAAGGRLADTQFEPTILLTPEGKTSAANEARRAEADDDLLAGAAGDPPAAPPREGGQSAPLFVEYWTGANKPATRGHPHRKSLPAPAVPAMGDAAGIFARHSAPLALPQQQQQQQQPAARPSIPSPDPLPPGRPRSAPAVAADPGEALVAHAAQYASAPARPDPSSVFARKPGARKRQPGTRTPAAPQPELTLETLKDQLQQPSDTFDADAASDGSECEMSDALRALSSLLDGTLAQVLRETGGPQSSSQQLMASVLMVAKRELLQIHKACQAERAKLKKAAESEACKARGTEEELRRVVNKTAVYLRDIAAECARQANENYSLKAKLDAAGLPQDDSACVIRGNSRAASPEARFERRHGPQHVKVVLPSSMRPRRSMARSVRAVSIQPLSIQPADGWSDGENGDGPQISEEELHRVRTRISELQHAIQAVRTMDPSTIISPHQQRALYSLMPFDATTAQTHPVQSHSVQPSRSYIVKHPTDPDGHSPRRSTSTPQSLRPVVPLHTQRWPSYSPYSPADADNTSQTHVIFPWDRRSATPSEH